MSIHEINENLFIRTSKFYQRLKNIEADADKLTTMLKFSDNLRLNVLINKALI